MRLRGRKYRLLRMQDHTTNDPGTPRRASRARVRPTFATMVAAHACLTLLLLALATPITGETRPNDGLDGTQYTSHDANLPNRRRITVPTAATAPAALPPLTRPLLRDLKTYCYRCHNGNRGERFDRFSKRPAFFAADTEEALVQNVREIAARAFRYLKLRKMPLATQPPLSMAKRDEIAYGIKALATTPPGGHTPAGDPVQLARARTAFARDIAPIIDEKCDACHGRGASWLQETLFNGTIRSAKRDWDVSDGYPFGGDYAADPVLQLSMLEVAVANRSMPPRAYVATRPQQRLSDDEVRRVLRWIRQARTAYRGTAPPSRPCARS